MILKSTNSHHNNNHHIKTEINHFRQIKKLMVSNSTNIVDNRCSNSNSVTKDSKCLLMLNKMDTFLSKCLNNQMEEVAQCLVNSTYLSSSNTLKTFNSSSNNSVPNRAIQGATLLNSILIQLNRCLRCSKFNLRCSFNNTKSISKNTIELFSKKRGRSNSICLYRWETEILREPTFLTK